MRQITLPFDIQEPFNLESIRYILVVADMNQKYHMTQQDILIKQCIPYQDMVRSKSHHHRPIQWDKNMKNQYHLDDLYKWHPSDMEDYDR